MAALRVLPLDVGVARVYDAFVSALGYERRSRYVAENVPLVARHRIVAAFTDRRDLSFRDNHIWYRSNGFSLFDVPDDEYGDWFEKQLRELHPRGATLEVAIDISSLSRPRLAAIVQRCSRVGALSGIVVDFLYAMAKYRSPGEEQQPFAWAGPVAPSFAGWTDDPDGPVVLVVGLGYETDRAVAAAELMEAADIWSFFPHGPELIFEQDVERANRLLWSRVPGRQRLDYRIGQPYETLAVLESTVFGASRTGRLIILPFGPKIFALCALLVASLHPEVGVWRVSPGASAAPVNQEASGVVVGLRSEFSA